MQDTEFKGSEVYWDEAAQAYVYQYHGRTVSELREESHRAWWMQHVAEWLLLDHGPEPIQF